MNSDNRRLYAEHAQRDGSGSASPPAAKWIQADELRKETVTRSAFASRVKTLRYGEHLAIPMTASSAEQRYHTSSSPSKASDTRRCRTAPNPAPHDATLDGAKGALGRTDSMEHESAVPWRVAHSPEDVEVQLRRRVTVLSTEVNQLRILLAAQQENTAPCSECTANSAQLLEEKGARLRAETALRRARAEVAKHKIVQRDNVRVSVDDPRLAEMRRTIATKDDEIRKLRKRCVTLETKLERETKKSAQQVPHILPDFNDVPIQHSDSAIDFSPRSSLQRSSSVMGSSPKNNPRIISCEQLPMAQVLSLECVSDF